MELPAGTGKYEIEAILILFLAGVYLAVVGN